MCLIQGEIPKLCKKCKNFYDITCSFEEGHTVCAAKECYHCAARIGSCDCFSKGDVPTGKTRGAFMDDEDDDD